MMMRVQPRRVEHAFFEIEFPGAVLLRHQQTLKLVGEARDDALHGGELLVEEGAQPRQFLGVAKLGRLDDLVELRGVDLVAPLVLMREWLLRPPRLHAVFGFGGVAQFVGLLDAELGVCVRAFFALGLLHVGFGGLTLRVCVLLGIAFLVFGVLRILACFIGLGVEIGIVAEIEVFQDRARDPGERLLVAQRVAQLVEVLARALLDPLAPEFGGLASGFRRRLAGQLLADDQTESICNRHVRAHARFGKSSRV